MSDLGHKGHKHSGSARRAKDNRGLYMQQGQRRGQWSRDSTGSSGWFSKSWMARFGSHWNADVYLDVDWASCTSRLAPVGRAWGVWGFSTPTPCIAACRPLSCFTASYLAVINMSRLAFRIIFSLRLMLRLRRLRGSFGLFQKWGVGRQNQRVWSIIKKVLWVFFSFLLRLLSVSPWIMVVIEASLQSLEETNP